MARADRATEISDRWTVCKSKLAFLTEISAMEANMVFKNKGQPCDDLHRNKDALWGRHFIMQDVLDEMSEAIEGDWPELKEVSSG